MCYNYNDTINLLGIVPAARKVVILTTFPSIYHRNCLGGNMNKYSGVYKITNIVNGKRYIGSSSDIYKRLAYHKYTLRRGQSGHIHLQRAFNKYGESNFIFSPLLYCDPGMSIFYEQMFLDQMHPEYNKAIYAELPMMGRIWTEEQRSKISKSRTGHKASKETRKKISDALRNRIISDETRAKMSAAQKGIPMSEKEREFLSSRSMGNKHKLGYITSDETKKKLSNANKGHKMTVEQREKLSKSLKGNKNALGHKVSPEAKAKMVHYKKISMEEKL